MIIFCVFLLLVDEVKVVVDEVGVFDYMVEFSIF